MPWALLLFYVCRSWYFVVVALLVVGFSRQSEVVSFGVEIVDCLIQCSQFVFSLPFAPAADTACGAAWRKFGTWYGMLACFFE